MASDSALKDQKVENPANNFENPSAVVKDKDLPLKEKKKALNTWEQDARQLLTASNVRWPRLFEQLFRVDKWSVCRV